MAIRKAAPIARKMFDYHSRADFDGLTHGEKISLSQRVGYLTRAIFVGRVRYLGKRGEAWPIERIKKYAEELRNYISDLRDKNQPAVELGRLELFLADLSKVL